VRACTCVWVCVGVRGCGWEGVRLAALVREHILVRKQWVWVWRPLLHTRDTHTTVSLLDCVLLQVWGPLLHTRAGAEDGLQRHMFR
jgi:hypothetical protein